ncbi:MAG: ABC-F family ATP-binding cassette domain-containing protein [Deltaproteobacteria bacterium]|nr:ABC-F family ATP-binding cassette domain-containing protein [Deltaproteobacteria bacterium]
MLLRLDQIAKGIGGRTLFRDASLVVRSGDRIGLVGPNGAGKTTLLRILAGSEKADAGKVAKPRGVRIGLLRQEIDPTQAHSVREEAGSALQRLDELEAELRSLEAEMARGEGEISGDVAERYDKASNEFAHGGGFEREARVAEVLAGLGFDEAMAARPLHTFSGGWLMRVELAKLFLSTPDVLLLDEPTNHLDLPTIEWFEASVDAFRGAVVTVSHDRTFLRRHVGRVVEVDGTGRCSVYEGDYDRYLEQRELRRSELLARKANQDREIAHMERFVDRFRAKSTKAKQAQSRIKALDKIERIEVEPDSVRRMRLRIPEPPRSGKRVVAAEGVSKRYGDNEVYTGVDIELHRGDRVALVGPNGAGKSTLLRILAGAIEPDDGERVLGHNVEVAFFAQHQLEALHASATVLEEMASDALTDDVPRLRGQLGAFLFSGDDVDKKVGVLSGGEKSRLALAKLLLRPANLLVLDEPTNHLDIAACEVLEQALSQYAGTLAFVSHDRAFLNALATRIVEVKDGRLREFIGNYDEYLAKVAQELEGPARAAESPSSTATSGTAGASESRARDARGSAKGRTKGGAKGGAKGDAKGGAKGGAAAAKGPGSADRTADGKAAGGGEAPRKLSKAERAVERERRKNLDRGQRKIAKLEEDIQAREAELEALGHSLGDPAVYSDAERVQALNAERQEIQAIIDGLYREWERLAHEVEILRDVLS